MADTPWLKKVWDSITGQPSTGQPSVPGPIVPPAGITLLHTLEAHSYSVSSLAWSPDGSLLASGSSDKTVRLWELRSGYLRHSLDAHSGWVSSLAWSPHGSFLASGSDDETVRLWDPRSGSLLHTLEAHAGSVWSLAWSPDGSLFASASVDKTIRLWNPRSNSLLHTLEVHTGYVSSLAWSPDGSLLASGSYDNTVRLWDPRSGSLLHTLEAHAGSVRSLAWSPDGSFLASGSSTGVPSYNAEVRIWHTGTWENVATLTNLKGWDNLALHPNLPLLATNGQRKEDIIIWQLDLARLMRRVSTPETTHSVEMMHHTNSVSPAADPISSVETVHHTNPVSPTSDPIPSVETAHFTNAVPPTTNPVHSTETAHHTNAAPPAADPIHSVETVHYANAKVVLVGDSGAGKSGLALVLTGHPFTATESTHGRHIWPLDEQEVLLENGVREKREVLLWDLAGQQDYRLIHQLHLHEATIALIVFDAARDTDPLAGIRHWQRALRQAQQARGSGSLPLTIFLVAARIDRGGLSVSRERINALAQELGCAGYIETSAKDGQGIAQLHEAIRSAIDWTRLPKVTSTKLLQSMKEFMLGEQRAGRLLRNEDDLYDAFLRTPDAPPSSDILHRQFETALGRLEAQGYINRLGFGSLILLQPELLDAYASALLIAVKKEPDGLGSILEARVQQGDFAVPQEVRLSNRGQERLLLIAMIDELVSNQLALREGGSLLFPSQSTREHAEAATLGDRQAVTFTFTGSVLSIYTTLVVRLAQSGIFEKRELWQRTVEYTTRLGGTFGLLLTQRGEERAELGLFFDDAARDEMRFYFEDFVQRHLERQVGANVKRQRRFVCPGCGELLPEAQVSRRLARGLTSITCGSCDTEVSLLDGAERLHSSSTNEVKQMERAADEQRERESAASILQGKIATNDFDVFLCYNRQDWATVQRIGTLLKEQGILPWLDEWELRPGLPWQQALEKEIGQIKTAAVFVGENNLGPWQSQELYAFLREFVDRRCPVIPVLLPDALEKPDLPLFLRGMTWVDFRTQQPDPMQRLIWGITGKRGSQIG